MKISKAGVAVLATVAVAAFAGSASAQSQPQPPPPPAGQALPGVCVLSNDKIVFNSVLGKYILSRLEQLKAQVDAELNSEGTAIDTDAKALEAQRATLPQDQFEQKGGAINARAQAFQRKVQQRQRELEDTRNLALGRLGTEADPVVRQVFTARGCSLMFNGGSLVYPAPTMDVTDLVIRGLDAKIQQFPFDREHLDASQGGQ
jgi:outer membrane protein